MNLFIVSICLILILVIVCVDWDERLECPECRNELTRTTYGFVCADCGQTYYDKEQATKWK